MAENENVAVEELPVEPQPVNNEPVNNGPSKGQKAKSKAKEWFRKKVVALKRKPQIIPLLFLAVTSVFSLLLLAEISNAIVEAKNATNTIGICIFVTTLLSLLVLVSFLNAFPKRKKPNIFFIVLVFVMIGGMVACDLVYYTEMQNYISTITDKTNSLYVIISGTQPSIIAHVVLLGVSALVFALLPVYKMLINKINTKVELESATESMHGEIDIQED